jgi:DNA polymerase III epsilon subunit-like protein
VRHDKHVNQRIKAQNFIDESIRLRKLSEESEAQEWKPNISGEIDYIIPFTGIAADIQRWIIDTSKKIQPAISLAATLSILSMIIGRHVVCDGIKGNMLIICLAESGEGKDWPRQAIQKVLDAVDMGECVYGQVASGAALIESLNETPSMLLSLDEIGHYFQSINSKYSNQYAREIMPIITECYSSSADKYTPKVRKGEKVKSILEPNLSVFGLSTERQIMDNLKSSEIADGSLARFWMLFGTDNNLLNRKKLKNDDVPRKIIDGLNELKEKYHRRHILKSMPLEVSEEYEQKRWYLADYFNRKAIKVGGTFKPLHNRDYVKCQQVALLIDQCASVQVLEWAAKLVEATTEIFIKKFQHMCADNENERLYKLLVAKIKESGKDGISARDLTRSTQQITPMLRKHMLRELEDVGSIFSRHNVLNSSHKATTFYFWAKKID